MTRCGIEPTCEDRCRYHAEQVFRDCRAGGGSAEECFVASRDALMACLSENCTLPYNLQCGLDAAQEFQVCRDNGGTLEDCSVAAQRFLGRCLNACP